MNRFSMPPAISYPRAQFDRSSDYKTAFQDMDQGINNYLIPVYCDEVLAGDTFKMKMTAFARLTALITPFMDNMYLDFQAWYVPSRLLWTNFTKMMGERANPGDSIDYLVPQLVAPSSPVGWQIQSLEDYFGLPLGVASLSVNALPRRAYGLIWNEWYRDENLQNRATVNLGDGPDTADWATIITDKDLLPRGQRHDYFTSALPSPQKGAAVSIPMATVSVVRNSNSNAVKWFKTNSNTIANAGAVTMGQITGSSYLLDNTSGNSLSIDPNGSLSAVGGTINALRTAEAVQTLLERDNRGGTRFTELLKQHFGVSPTDDRLQRPEFLGSSSQMINVNPIAQTSRTETGSPQANLAAMATTTGRLSFIKSFVEPGYLMILASIRADLTYFQGLDRSWSRRTRYDFYWPSLANVGEQAILSKELYCDGSSGDNDVFGYQAMWEDYRYKISRVTGLYRTLIAGNTAVSGNLGIWHLARPFNPRPTLGDGFIRSYVPVDRVSAVPTEPMVLLDAHFDLKCVRPMPMYSVPGLGVRF